MNADQFRQQLFRSDTQYAEQKFANKQFIPNESPVLISGNVFDFQEVCNIADSALDFHEERQI